MKWGRAAAAAACLAALPGAAEAAVVPIHAHRGGSVLDGVPRFPENTLPAFRNAAKSGWVLEMDAKLSKDRVPVVIHDPTLDRTTPCSGRVDSKTLAELRACPPDVLGTAGMTVNLKGREPIPTLAEALALAVSEGAFVNLEIKNVPTDADFDSSPAFANAVLDVVVRSGLPADRLIVQSFWPPNLAATQARLPAVETSILTLSQMNDGAPAYAAANGHEWVSPAYPISRGFVDQAHSLGRKVVPYTLNTVSDIRGAAALGVEAIISDDPALTQRTLGLTRRQLAPDLLDPSARINAPRYASNTARGVRFRVGMRGEDRGSGLAGLQLEVRRNTNASTRWRKVGRETLARGRRFRGRPGATYLFRLRARDRFGNLSPYVYDLTSVPFDDRSRRVRFSAGWSTLSSDVAYGSSVHRALRRGASATVRFRGSRVALIAPRLRRGGRLLVQVDRRSRVVSVRGRARARRVVFRSRGMRPGRHRLRVVALGGGRVELDAVAVEQGPPTPD